MLKEPDVGLISEHSIDINVVLPAPLGPSKPKIVPSAISKSKFNTEKKSAFLYFLESC